MLSWCQMTAINNNKTRTPSVIKQLLASSEALKELEVEDELVSLAQMASVEFRGAQ